MEIFDVDIPKEHILYAGYLHRLPHRVDCEPQGFQTRDFKEAEKFLTCYGRIIVLKIKFV